VKGSFLASRSDSLVCPLCEAGELRLSDHTSARCASCASLLNGAMVETLRQITALPEGHGSHPCDSGHPEMRLLPDATFHCPACGSEVAPISDPSSPSKRNESGEAYRAGWVDGRFGETSGSFVDNANLARWEKPSERLAYYRGHRAGSEARGGNNGRDPGGTSFPNRNGTALP
jgi:hypothetical protein